MHALTVFLTTSFKLPHAEMHHFDDGPEQQRAYSRLVLEDADAPREWLAACILGPSNLLVCTFNSHPGHPDLPAAEHMLSEIQVQGSA